MFSERSRHSGKFCPRLEAPKEPQASPKLHLISSESRPAQEAGLSFKTYLSDITPREKKKNLLLEDKSRVSVDTGGSV